MCLQVGRSINGQGKSHNGIKVGHSGGGGKFASTCQ